MNIKKNIRIKKIITNILIVSQVITLVYLTSCNFIEKKTPGQSYEVLHAISTEKSEEVKETENLEIIEETNNSETLETHDIEDTTENAIQNINYDELNIDRVRDPNIELERIFIDFTTPYATFSVINSGSSVLYKHIEGGRKKTVAINAGHGTKNASQIKTWSHPDFTPKLAGGTTEAGEFISTAVSEGMVFNDKGTEGEVNLLVAERLKDYLLNEGYDVLMIRTDDNCQLDNVARTVIANRNADCHIAIHFDSTNEDKGIFYIAPLNDERYLNMEPVKSNAWRVNKLGTSIIKAFKDMGEKIWKSKGVLYGDLTQISYSTIASVDIELGDKKTEITDEKIDIFVKGIKKGIDSYFYD